MASSYLPVINTAYTFIVKLFAQSDGEWLTAPTIAAGDFKVTTYDEAGADESGPTNPATLPAVDPAGSGNVVIYLSASEMNHNKVVVDWKDSTGAEWQSGALVLQTVANGADDLASKTNITGGTITTVTNLTNAPTNGDLTATMKASVNTEVDTGITDAALATAANLATVDGNVDAILLDTGTDGVVLSTAQMQAMADILLGRSASNADATAATHSLYELIEAILESDMSGGSWVIKKTDGATTFNTRTLTSDPAAVPVVGVS